MKFDFLTGNIASIEMRCEIYVNFYWGRGILREALSSTSKKLIIYLG